MREIKVKLRSQNRVDNFLVYHMEVLGPEHILVERTLPVVHRYRLCSQCRSFGLVRRYLLLSEFTLLNF